MRFVVWHMHFQKFHMGGHRWNRFISTWRPEAGKGGVMPKQEQPYGGLVHTMFTRAVGAGKEWIRKASEGLVENIVSRGFPLMSDDGKLGCEKS